MHRSAMDFTQTFKSLERYLTLSDAQVPAELSEWLNEWRLRGESERLSPVQRITLMRTTNPTYIPRNHRIEQAIVAAVEHQDFAPFETLLTVLSRPFDEQPAFERYTAAPEPVERVLQTFCGT
jgi:uncharacterized protein YdiU (UPF0061 family)